MSNGEGNRPNFVVLAKKDSNDQDSPLIQVGAAWLRTSISQERPYIWIRLDSKPWGNWDGILQLHEFKDFNTIGRPDLRVVKDEEDWDGYAVL